MADRGASALSLPDDWPAHPDPILVLNRMGSFDWDLDTGLMQMDAQAHEVFDVRPDEYDDHPETLAKRVPPDESRRLDTAVSRALKDGSENYGAYFRIRRRDGSLRWTHTQGYIRRDDTGRPRRIIGIIRDATRELGESDARLDQAARDEARREQTSVVELTTAALAHARTVQDVIDVLKDTHGLVHLGATSLVMGLVEAGRIRLVAEGPSDSFVPGTRVTRIDEPYPMSEAVRTLGPCFIESPQEFAERYPVLWPHITDLDITSAAYLPLIVQARPIGVMGLLYSDRYGFTSEERNILVALGSSIAQSLQRAMFYEQEMDLAQGLQQAMLPRTIPSVPGADVAVRYRAATIGGSVGRDIGGDWYDLIPLPGGRVGAVIGDVQGHDTHAAAVMGQLRIVLRAYAAEGHPPATVMARASVFLHELDTDRSATCLYAEADLSTGVLQMVRAGHIDPLVRHTDGSCRRVTVPGGLPLGLSAEFGRLEYPVGTIELDPRRHPAAVHRRSGGAARRRPRRRHAHPERTRRHRPRRRTGPRRAADRRGRRARRRRRRGAAPAAPARPREPPVRTPAPAARGPRRPRGPRRRPAHDPHRGRRLGSGRARRRDRTGRRRADHQRPDAHRGRCRRHPAGLHRIRKPAARRGRGLLQRTAAPP